MSYASLTLDNGSALIQAAEDERMRMQDEERSEWESSQGAGPRAEV